ncbi:MAG: hypothetical protein FVQ77_12145 [Cytophagales bacterium]|nr:hypothetical protein [Cytophagales bacterium]
MQNRELPKDFRDFITCLNKYQVEYLLIGGYAVGAYGYLRFTNDLDIFINATDNNAKKMIASCTEFGIPKEQIRKEMFLVSKMIRIGDLPFRIEILKKLDTVDFKYAYDRRKIANIDDIQVNVVSLDDLILLKKAAAKGRTKARDKEDLNYLEELKRQDKN